MSDGTPAPRTGSGLQLLQNSFLLLGIEGFSKLLGLIFFILVARYLGAAELGLYTTAITWANLFVLLPRFGLENLVQRDVGQRPETARAYWRHLGLLKTGLTLAALLGLGVTLGMLFRSEWPVMLAIGIFVCTYSFLEFFNSFFRALGQAAGEVLSRLWFSLTNLGLGAWVLSHGGRLPAVAAVQLGSSSSALLVAGWLLARFSRPSPAASYQEPYRELWRRAAPFAGIAVALFCSNQAGTLLLSLTQPETAVGYLAAGLRLFDNLTLLPAAVMGAFLPVASREHRRSLRAFVLTCRYTLKYLVILGAPLAVGLFCLAQPLTLSLYRAEFLSTVGVLQLLAPALLCSFWNYLGDNMLIARNREQRLFVLAWLAAALHAGANALLIPWFSHLGVAAATLLTQGGYSLILLAQHRRYFGGRRLVSLLGRPAACAAGMGLAVWWLQDQPLPVVVGIGAGIYLGLLLGSRTVTSQEWQYFKQLWRRSPLVPAAGG